MYSPSAFNSLKSTLPVVSSLFKLHPEVKRLFGLADLEADELRSSKRFKMQAIYMIQMLDTSLQVR